jgi:hypothetical protein
MEVLVFAIEPLSVPAAVRPEERLGGGVASSECQEEAVVALGTASRSATVANRSPANSRMVSSMPSLVEPSFCRRRTSRLLATSRSSVSMPAPGDRLGRLDRGAAGEHREAREAPGRAALAIDL